MREVTAQAGRRRMETEQLRPYKGTARNGSSAGWQIAILRLAGLCAALCCSSPALQHPWSSHDGWKGFIANPPAARWREHRDALPFCLLCSWWPRGATRPKLIYHSHAGAAPRKVNSRCFVAKLFNILRSKIVNSNRNIAALLKMEFSYYFQLKRPLSTGNVINSAFVWWKMSPLEELQLARAPQLSPYWSVFTDSQSIKQLEEAFPSPTAKLRVRRHQKHHSITPSPRAKQTQLQHFKAVPQHPFTWIAANSLQITTKSELCYPRLSFSLAEGAHVTTEIAPVLYQVLSEGNGNGLYLRAASSHRWSNQGCYKASLKHPRLEA